MDFRDSPAEAEFRQRLRAWLVENNPGLPASSTDDEYWTRQAEWHTALYDAGFFGLSWPKKYGGHELPTVFDVILDEELAAAGTPPRPSLGYLVQGITTHANEDIQNRFLPGLISGRERWCQGFSEPDAGSDLANIKTRAVLDGDEWVLNGQKVWTTLAHHAQWIFAVCRTDPDAPKHKGLSYLLVPMDQPGIDVKPLKQLTGSAEFNEVFFTDARTAKDLVVGDVNDGWKIAMGTLGFERGTAFLAQQLQFNNECQSVIDYAKKHDLAGDPLVRQKLADAWMGVQIMKYNGFRMISRLLATGSPGPEASISKLYWSTWHVRLGELEMELMGPWSQVFASTADAPQYEPEGFQQTFLASRGETIYTGSSEIQKNIIGERVLGLPREPA